MSQPRQTALDSVLRAHRSLEARVRTASASPTEVLEAGRHLLAFAAREDEAFRAVLPLLDPAVRQQLDLDHAQLEEDLELLEWLLRNTPESPDVPALASSLHHRMSAHVERDGRLLARATRMPAR